jgi:hypothetical protein
VDSNLKRSKSTYSLVYAYGLVPPVEQKLPKHLADMMTKNDYSCVDAEIEKQRAMWDALVAMDREHGRLIDEYIIGQCEEYAEAVRAFNEAQAALDSLMFKARPAVEQGLEKVTAKSIIAGVFEKNEPDQVMIQHPGIDDTFKNQPPQRTHASLIEARNATRRKMWDISKNWRKEHKGVYKIFEASRQEKMKKIRHESGLYWGNYNRVLNSYDAARKLSMRTGRKVKFSDWSRRDGCLTVQIQRTSTGLGAAPSELFDGSLSMIQIAPVPEGVEYLPTGKRTRACKTLAEFRVDAEGNMIRCPVWMHRPLPPGSRIKSVQIVWYKQGNQYKGRLCFTLSMPAPIPIKRKNNQVCSIELSCDNQPDGSLKIATVRTLKGETEEVVLPPRWSSGMDQAERLGKYVHRDLTAVASYIKEDYSDFPILQEVTNHYSDHFGYRSVSPAKLCEAVEFLEFKVPDFVVGWYHRYQHLAVWRDNLRARLIRRRREEYRLAVRKVAMNFAIIDLIVPADNGTDAKTKLRAAHSVFKAELAHQARKHGAELRIAEEKRRAA